MHIYEDEGALAALAARLVVEAMRIEQPAVVISSEPITSMILEELHRHDLDANDLRRQDRLQMIDAEWLLEQVMLGGLPDPNRFSEHLRSVLRKVCARRDPCVPVIYSDLADRLIKSGHTTAAISLEILWNRLAGMHSFSLLCGFAAADLKRRVPTWDELQAICEQHNTVQRRPN
jgi:hypothetical protein